MPVVAEPRARRWWRLPLRFVTDVDARALGGAVAVLTAGAYQAWAYPDLGAGAGAAWGTVVTVLFGALLGGRSGASIVAADDAHKAAVELAAARVLTSTADTRQALAAEIRSMPGPVVRD